MTSSLKAKIVIPGNLPQPLWYAVPEHLKELCSSGTLVKVPIQSRTVYGLILETKKEEFHFKTKDIIEVLPDQQPFSDYYLETLKWVANYYHTTLSKVLQASLSKQSLNALLPLKRKVKQKELGKFFAQPSPPLTKDQTLAVNTIEPYITSTKSQGEFKSFLLHGVTGSGKTLVYIHLVKKCLEFNKTVLILLPEISLTPQTLSTFQNALGERVYTAHSNLTAGDRRALWQGLAQNKIRVVLGVRSAILLPLDNIGLIIVDEEHDTGYKQSDTNPKYNARDVALFRGKLNQCPVVLGSATPSLETYYSALQKKHTLLEMPQRATQAPLPQIQLIDMGEQLELQGDIPLSIPLREALNAALKKGEQAILLLNRRGFAKVRLDASGQPIQCPRCSVPLIPHKLERRLFCHHCGFYKTTEVGSDESKEYIDKGWAIEKLESYLNDIYPQYTIIRLDRDNTSRKGSLEKLLAEFDSGKAQILIGTQMIAKGHDFKKVNLVGVLDSDSGLGLPDFRAQERSFQLLTQVAGRAGRHSDRGQVFIQTFQPQNPVLKLALENNYQQFYHDEIKTRTELFYPPFSKLIKIEITGKEEAQVWSAIQKFASIFTHYGKQIDLKRLGPGQAAIHKINHLYRSQVFGKSKSSKQLQWALSESLKQYFKLNLRTVKLTVDIDPLSVM